jgi:hypothetical protein
VVVGNAAAKVVAAKQKELPRERLQHKIRINLILMHFILIDNLYHLKIIKKSFLGIIREAFI